MKAFDRKFGSIAELSTGPGVYLFRDADDVVVYVGKAKNLRRRIASYRNATRKKVHRKQRAIVRTAASLETRTVDTERDALLLENELIRTLRPRMNVDGKFDFLYPSIGLARRDRTTLLCFSTHPDAYDALSLRWFGCFRSRLRARDAFDAMLLLLGFLGHAERVADAPRIRGSLTRGFRRIDRALVDELARYLAGESDDALRTIAHALVDRPAARRDATDVHESLRTLADFYRSDLVPLRRAIRAAKLKTTHVAQAERDALFLRTA